MVKIAVIGGTRGLGRWIAKFLAEKGFDVLITGRNVTDGELVSKKIGTGYTNNNSLAAETSDVVIISVPIHATPNIIKELAPLMKPGSLLMDVTSVKEESSHLMEQYAAEGVEVVPSHPMFGPRIRSLDGQVVVLTPSVDGSWYTKVYKFLEHENTRIIVTTPEIHDRMMSIVQGLTHFAYVSIAATIDRLDIDIKESRKFASPIYNLMLDTIARITAQNPYLVYSIQTSNKYIKDAHETFNETFNELKNMIADGDEEGFVHAMSNAAKHIDDLESALGRSDKAISALSEEVNILKNLVGREVGLKHIYSGKVHVGMLEELKPEFLVLKLNNSSTKLKLSNVEILTDKELKDWKINNYPLRSYDVSAVFPESADPEVVVATVQGLEGVVDAEVMDTYSGSQIPEGSISITLRYLVFDDDAVLEVEKLLKGFGCQIR
ncbi:Prephenate dehydrogenase [Methanobacterium lacus]|uniref:Prephenate dehydrogenase n=1 Tax=Methanobacterium lacus (strain AL-21) TaxID=877455 RepID=F0TBU0_METLA|nr:prephenate dehydrogenase [Methanobacterium lacus]ADZ10282.1 Prephenate dehydrogenase [Methanobacterium lacus]